MVDIFPLAGLRLRTPRLELRLPTQEELAELADLAAGGIHEPDASPFGVPWTDGSPAEVARRVVHHYWRLLGEWTPQRWQMPLTVFLDGTAVGRQDIGAHDFAITREVSTGSWLGRGYQGRGIGTEMRAAVLHLAFAGLDAVSATSGAMTFNQASLAVSRKLGYEPDGLARVAINGELRVEQRLRLTREAWERHRTVPVTVEGPALAAIA